MVEFATDLYMCQWSVQEYVTTLTELSKASLLLSGGILQEYNLFEEVGRIVGRIIEKCQILAQEKFKEKWIASKMPHNNYTWETFNNLFQYGIGLIYLSFKYHQYGHIYLWIYCNSPIQ